MYVDKCVFIDGEHYGPPGCYHEQSQDELGSIQEPGWTVNNRHPNEEVEQCPI